MESASIVLQGHTSAGKSSLANALQENAAGPVVHAVCGCLAAAFMASLLVLAGCAPPRWDTATYDRFPLNSGRTERGAVPIRTIALVPGGGVVAEAVGVELTKRGFVVVPSASTERMAPAVNYESVLHHHIPARRDAGEMWKLRHALHAHGVDAFLIVRAHDFAPKQYLGRTFWQQAALEIYSTTEENPTSSGAIAGTAFANFQTDRAASPSEAAAAMVMNLARGPGGI